MESEIETLFEIKPYSLSQKEKNDIFSKAMNESVRFHYEKSNEFRKICDNRNFLPENSSSVEAIPFLPVSLFKTFQLRSVPESEIIKTISVSYTHLTLPTKA